MRIPLAAINKVCICLISLVIPLNICDGAAIASPSKVQSQKSPYTVSSIPDNTLTIGWFDSEPYYSLVKGRGGLESYSGLDAELARAVAGAMGYKVNYKPIEWSEQVENLKKERNILRRPQHLLKSVQSLYIFQMHIAEKTIHFLLERAREEKSLLKQEIWKDLLNL